MGLLRPLSLTHHGRSDYSYNTLPPSCHMVWRPLAKQRSAWHDSIMQHPFLHRDWANAVVDYIPWFAKRNANTLTMSELHVISTEFQFPVSKGNDLKCFFFITAGQFPRIWCCFGNVQAGMIYFAQRVLRKYLTLVGCGPCLLISSIAPFSFEIIHFHLFSATIGMIHKVNELKHTLCIFVPSLYGWFLSKQNNMAVGMQTCPCGTGMVKFGVSELYPSNYLHSH